MRPIPAEVLARIQDWMDDCQFTSADLRRRYTEGFCHTVASALVELDPERLQPWVLCNRSYEKYDALQDYMSDPDAWVGKAPDLVSGHAFVMVKGDPRQMVLDIEGLRPLKNMRGQVKWCYLDHCFTVPAWDFDRWTVSDDAEMDEFVAQVLYEHYIKNPTQEPLS